MTEERVLGAAMIGIVAVTLGGILLITGALADVPTLALIGAGLILAPPGIALGFAFDACMSAIEEYYGGKSDE